METAEVVIIGGGIVGASIAWYLTDAGCRNVLIIERESHQGKGSTGKSMGGVRAQFATAPNIQMSLYSIRFYSEFDERLGQPGGYRPQGYLFVATAQKHLDYLRTNQNLQHSLGLSQARMVACDEIIDRVPQLRSNDILGGSFCPTDGFVDPYSVMTGFTTCAVERGARVWRSAKVSVIHRNGGLLAACGFLVGAALFAGDLSLRHFAGHSLFPFAAPTGGTLLIASWLVLAMAAAWPRRK